MNIEVFNTGTGYVESRALPSSLLSPDCSCFSCSDATDVSVEEPEWDFHLFETEGDMSGSFDTIPAGVTKSFSYVIIPKLPLNRFEQPELTVSYNDGDRKISTKGPKEYLKIHSKEELLKKKILDAGSMATLGMITSEEQWIRTIVVGGGIFITLFAFRLAKKVQDIVQNSKRKSALKEFGFKDE